MSRGSSIPIATPWLDEEEQAAAREVIASGWVTQGPRVKELESAFAAKVGSRFACAVSSCTSALHMALLAQGVKPGDVVLAPSHSFIATANAIRACGAEPYFIDVEESSFNMDPRLLIDALESFPRRDGRPFVPEPARLARGESPLSHLAALCGGTGKLGRVSAVLAVHQIGIPCAIREIRETARRFGLALVEDAACAVGSAWRESEDSPWRRVGDAGSGIACFSFHPRKLVTTGDGGMLTTDDDRSNRFFRLYRHHGMSLSDLDRHSSSVPLTESYEITGFNYRMTDIQAAIGSAQLRKLDVMIERRTAQAERYRSGLAGTPWLRCYEPTAVSKTNWQSFPVVLADPGGRDGLSRFLLDRGIASRPGIMNAHEEPPYAPQGWSLPVSENLRRSTILLPIHHRLEDSQIDFIVESVLRSRQ